MQQKIPTDPKKQKISRLYREPHLTFNQSAGLIILFAIISGVLVNFYNTVHYSNLLSQADGQVSAAQYELGKEQYDVKFLISNNSKQINCYDLQSEYARGLCTAHNSSINNTSL